MRYLIKENGFLFDMNVQNIRIECLKSETNEKPINIGHSFDCLCFVTGGYGSVKLGGTTNSGLKRGSVFYVPKGAKAVSQSVGTETYELYSLVIDVPDNKGFFSALGFFGNNPVRFLEGRMGIVEEVYETAKEDSVAGSYKCLSLLFKLFALLAKQYGKSAKPATDKNEYVEQALRYIHTQYYEDINVNKIANLLHINRSYFSMLFKKVTGMNPLEYLTNYRIKLARKLLKMDKSVTDVAMLTGFNSIGNFNLQFKRIMKMTPSEYKIQLKEQGKIK